MEGYAYILFIYYIVLHRDLNIHKSLVSLWENQLHIYAEAHIYRFRKRIIRVTIKQKYPKHSSGCGIRYGRRCEDLLDFSILFVYTV